MQKIFPDYVSKYTNLNYLFQRTKSNPPLLIEMIKLYLNQTPSLIQVMKKSLKEEDWKSLHAAVHKMIPSFAIMGIRKEFEDLAKRIQENASAFHRTDEIADLVYQLEIACGQSCKELEDFLMNMKNK